MPSDKRARQRANSAARQAALRAQRRRKQQRRQFIAFFIFIVVVGGGVIFATRGSGKKTTAAAAPNCPPSNGSAAKTMKFTAPQPTCIDKTKHYTAAMQTDAGTVTLALDPVKAPVAVNNFVVLARYHFYDGIIFHRVIPDFMDQGGDPTGTGTGGPGYTFADELPAAGAYKAGSLAMANSGPNTNGSQFFVVASDNGAKSLSPNYTLFGQVTAGMDVVKKINDDGTPGSGTPPKVTHKIISVKITES